MSTFDILLLLASAFVAGLVNSVAGGGTFLSFPALVSVGIPPVIANATNTVALFPGQLASAWAYRQNFPRLADLRPMPLIIISLAGGAVGAELLVLTPSRAFSALVPWLLFFATSVFAVSPRLVPWLKARWRIGSGPLLGVQFLLSIYGGYFGGAVGILMLALFGLFGLSDIHAANALKTLLSGLVNAMAVVCFLLAKSVALAPGALMLLSAIAGGYSGARLARRLPATIVRRAIIVMGYSMSIVFFRMR